MSARPRDTRDTPDPAARDDDPVRRSSQPGADPKANPQAAEDRGGRPPRAVRERDLRFGLLPALLLSLVVHGAALAAFGRMVFATGDTPPGLSLHGTGARGEPSGDGDGIFITVRRGGGSGALTKSASDAASEPGEVMVQAEPPAQAAQPEPIEPTPSAPHEEPLVAQQVERAPVEAEPIVSATPIVAPEPRDVVAVPAFAMPEPSEAVVQPTPVEAVVAQPVAAAVAQHEPVATLGEWEGPEAPAGLASNTGAAQGALVASAALVGGNGDGHGQGGLGDGSGAGSGADAQGGGAGGAGAGGGLGTGPGGNNGNGVLGPSPLAGNEPPDYPYEARRAGEEGLVLVHAHVAADGSVTAVELTTSCGHERLDRAALDAVALWLFEPARHAGQAVAQEVDIPIHFRLNPR